MPKVAEIAAKAKFGSALSRSSLPNFRQRRMRATTLIRRFCMASPLRSVLIPAFCSIVLFSAALASPPANTDGKASGLGAANIAKLRKTGLTVVVPTYIPSGFKVDSVEYDKQKTQVESSISYTYKNKKTGGEIIIQMASDGLGDPIFDTEEDYDWKQVKETVGNSPVFGKYTMESLQTKKGLMVQCTWYELPGKLYPRFVMMFGKNLKPAYAIKVMNSLRFLTKR